MVKKQVCRWTDAKLSTNLEGGFASSFLPKGDRVSLKHCISLSALMVLTFLAAGCTEMKQTTESQIIPIR